MTSDNDDGAVNPFDQHHWDYSSWYFWSRADDHDKGVQLTLQAEFLRASPGSTIGEESFISPLAAVQVEHLELGSNSYISGHAYLTGTLTTGPNCTINSFSVVRGVIRLGHSVRIGAHTSILAFNHTFSDPDVPVFRQTGTQRGITIGDDVWIGSHVLILDGVTIGDRAVVAGGSIVTKDVPSGAIVAGNPAAVKKWRVPELAPRQPQTDTLAARVAAFDTVVRSEATTILDRSWDASLSCYVDAPGERVTVRAHCDAIEIARYLTDDVPAHLPREEHVRRLRALQDPTSGMLAALNADGSLGAVVTDVHDTANYNILCAGYALDVLGSRLEHPIHAVENLGADHLIAALEAQPWQGHPWRSGHFVDVLGTALLWNRRAGTPGHATTAAALFGWLHTAIDPRTGMWGTNDPRTGQLEIVNGFYRAARGSFAQFDVPVPFRERVVDTVLQHAQDARFFAPDRQNACNVLDVAQPLWLAGREHTYRQEEIQQVARSLLVDAISHWHPSEGFGFAAPSGTGRDPAAQMPALRGTEMWLAIIWYLADLAGVASSLSYRPTGIHRPEPADRLLR